MPLRAPTTQASDEEHPMTSMLALRRRRPSRGGGTAAPKEMELALRQARVNLDSNALSYPSSLGTKEDIGFEGLLLLVGRVGQTLWKPTLVMIAWSCVRASVDLASLTARLAAQGSTGTLRLPRMIVTFPI
jgi:hypothetical protein